MLAHDHGQVWNSSEFARSFGVADTTVRNYLDVLASALVITELQAWHENIGKRQIKSLDVVHAGEQTFPLADGVRAVAFSKLLENSKPWRGVSRLFPSP